MDTIAIVGKFSAKGEGTSSNNAIRLEDLHRNNSTKAVGNIITKRTNDRFVCVLEGEASCHHYLHGIFHCCS